MVGLNRLKSGGYGDCKEGGRCWLERCGLGWAKGSGNDAIEGDLVVLPDAPRAKTR